MGIHITNPKIERSAKSRCFKVKGIEANTVLDVSSFCPKPNHSPAHKKQEQAVNGYRDAAG